MSFPSGEVVVPPAVIRLANGAPLQPVWINELGGRTFRTSDHRFIKWGPRNGETTFEGEVARMRWARAFIRVPEVVTSGGDRTHEWMVTIALEGESAVSARWLADPAAAVRAVGQGLRSLHEALPVPDCPFDWGVPVRIAKARQRGVSTANALLDPPAVDQFVVCHGDACCPNTLLGVDGNFTGHVDLGALGVADRWADIAVAAMSTEWNYGPGWTHALVEAYGIEPDAVRLSYYRDLWNAL